MNLFLKHFYFSVVIGMGSMVDGIINAYYSPTSATMNPELGFSDSQGNLFNTFGILFAAAGGLIAKPYVLLVGRKLGVLLIGILTFLAFLMMALTKVTWLAYISRVIQGLIVGINSTICPMYLVEIAPTEYRGTFAVFHQIFVNIGLLYTYFLGIFMEWRKLTWMLLIIPGILIALIWTVPNSRVVETNQESESIFQKKFLACALHSLALVFSQQFSGINAVLTNLNAIFAEANSSLKPSVSASIVALVHVVATIFCSFIVEKIGRTKTWTIACFDETLALLLLWMNYVWDLWPTLPLIGLILYMIGFGLGLGPIVWTVIPELFPDSVRSYFVAISVNINWLFGGLLTFLWPSMKESMGSGWTFFLFAVVCFMSGIYGIFLMPETKGKGIGQTLEVHNEDISDQSEATNPPAAEL
jgi:MFS family permease